jgi:hypothetical protein
VVPTQNGHALERIEKGDPRPMLTLIKRETDPVIRQAVVVVLSLAVLMSCGGCCSALHHSGRLNLAFPAGYGLSRVTVAGSDRVVLKRGAQIRATDGSPGTVTNSGDGRIHVAEGGQVGAVVSTGAIALGRHVTAVKLQSSATVELGTSDTVGSVQQSAVLTPLVRREISVSMPAGEAKDIHIKPGVTTTLPPGRYRRLKIGAHSSVTLSAGTYVAKYFSLGSAAQLHLNTAGGSIRLFVEKCAHWNGLVSGDASRFVFGLLSTGHLALKEGFQGTALAPSGTLKLARSPSPYLGIFYAKRVVVKEGVIVEGLKTPLLVDGLTVSKTATCIGEQTEVSLDTGGAGSGATSWIGGVVGNHQFVEFSDAPGPRTIWASVYTPDGRADFATIPIAVKECAPQAGVAPPIGFHFWGALAKPNAVEFMVHAFDANRHETPPVAPAKYNWSFGDGQAATTDSPFVAHDYSASVNPLAPYNFFDVVVTSVSAAGTTTTRKVVPIWSLYAKNRSKGIVQPHSVLDVSPAALAMTVTNVEPAPIVIEKANVELIPCDPALAPRLQAPQVLSITIAAGATVTVNVAQPASIAKDDCSLGVHLIGTAAAGRVYSDSYQSLKENPLMTRIVSDAPTISLLNQAAMLTKDPKHFDEFEIRELNAAGLLPPLRSPTPSAIHLGLHNLPAPIAPADLAPSVGQPCSPGDTSPLGLICQPNAGWVFIGPEILNAFKGDFIMDHGCGFIGELLSSINQLFSHTSTVVKSRVEVRHSTASSDRMNDNVDYARERLDPDTIQYGFPGTAGPDQSYTIDEMVNQYFVTDPHDSSKQWRMGGELDPNPSQCHGDATPISPIVVRPAPDAPASVLSGVSSVADHTHISNHYRFVNYSKPESLAGADWATGTTSSVCSSFDLLAATGAGLKLRPTSSKPGVPDGMREYSTDERTTAGHTLFNKVEDQVAASCNGTAAGAVIGGVGWLIGGPVGGVIGAVLGKGYCSRITNNIASQITNCFANDGCDDTGDAWMNPGPGVAVSPDDMLDWDTADHGGTYGYNERLVYQPSGYRHTFEWAASPGSGSMKVSVVRTDRTPYPDATLLINTNPIGTTDSQGIFSIPKIAAGDYQVGAQFDPCAQSGHPNGCTLPLDQASVPATVPFNGSTNVSLTLCHGPVIGGVVTSCPQPGSGPSLTVSMTETQTGPDVCFAGKGFTPNAPVKVTYSNVPRHSDRQFSLSTDASGKIKPNTDFNWEGGLVNFCTQDQIDGEVQIKALDNVSDVAVTESVPAAYWCAGAGVSTNFHGGCN